jgi:hypothetical protein
MRTLAAALLLTLVACSGRGQGKSPEGAVKLLISAAGSGDRLAVFQRLGPRTRARIQTLQEATKRTGGRLVTRPEDFLAVGWAVPAWDMAGTRLLREEGATAEVEVYSATGDRHTLSLVREGAEWKVELPGQ